ncbi:beta-1,6-N-acetylglucosaminyltransferase [Hwangdonia sp.]|uniref:beta-1,6-N-acetylglucosaminyltransferase n=1 Tax=Hwangdonia sp. TaxID=1883432 RepID=UPI003AB4838F
MKQAILIAAYKNFDHLLEIINFFNDDVFEIYLHIDKKTKLPKSFVRKLNAAGNLKLLSRKYTVNWGGTNQLNCYLLLAEEAIKTKENVYFHLISGQDFPVKSITEFKKLFDNPIKHDYLENFELPREKWKNENGGFDRFLYYYFFDISYAHKFKKEILFLVKIQKKLSIKRSFPSKIKKYYGGSSWWSLTRDTLQYVIGYTKENPYLLKRMKYTLASDEIYFQTVIMNSAYAKNVINDNLRYIDWSPERIGKYNPSPALLDLSDFEKIKNSNKLFARKFDVPFSDDLKHAILNSRKVGN